MPLIKQIVNEIYGDIIIPCSLRFKIIRINSDVTSYRMSLACLMLGLRYVYLRHKVVYNRFWPKLNFGPSQILT